MKECVFPKTTGKFSVGVTHEEFEYKGKEPVMIPLTIFYPAKETESGKREKYAFAEAVFGLPLSQEDTRFLAEGEPAEEGKYPVVFYNHGYRSYEMSNSILCGELASRGYVVVAIGHTKEATAVKLKDGTVVMMDERLNAETDEPAKEASLLEIMQEAAKMEDVESNEKTFVGMGSEFNRIHKKEERMSIWCRQIQAAADFIEQYNKMEGHLLSGRLDLEKGIALTGHSFGGAASITACREDERFVCGIDIDGANLEYRYAEDTGKPLMIIGSSLSCKLLRGIYLHNTKDTYQLLVDKVEHMGFTDLAFFPEIAGMLGIPLGEKNAEETTKILAEYHDMFFKKYLLGEAIIAEESLDGDMKMRYKEEN